MTTRLIFYIAVGRPDTNAARECPDCGFDALLDFPLTAITADGVGPFGTVAACARCYSEEQR